MSDKPYNTVKSTTAGTIKPVVHYFTPTNQHQRSKITKNLKKMKFWLKSKLLDEDIVDELNYSFVKAESEHEVKVTEKQILDAEDLLSSQRECLDNESKSKKEEKQIISDSLDSNDRQDNSEDFYQHYVDKSRSRPSPNISLPSPLPPLYQPGQQVPGVWSANHTTERLYRYTHIEGIIYPPGYVP